MGTCSKRRQCPFSCVAKTRNLDKTKGQPFVVFGRRRSCVSGFADVLRASTVEGSAFLPTGVAIKM
jgi:hypothetical protein